MRSERFAPARLMSAAPPRTAQ